jgi:hypothetical protein
MSLWDFDSIKEEVRGLTMKRSPNQISEIELGNKINQYFFYKFPQEVNPPELHDMYDFVTIDGTQAYTVDQDEVVAFNGTVYVSETDTVGDPSTLWLDPDLYYLSYPTEGLTTAMEAEPTDFLYYGGQLILTPVPDAVYYVKMPCIIRPTTFSDPTDVPTANGRSYEEWGSAIAHGAAIDILERSGEDDRLAQVRGWYRQEILYLKKKFAFQNSSKRPLCKF